MAEPRVDYRICTLCDAMCGIAVEHDGERILSLRGDPDDRFSRGHVCPKVVGMADVQADPDRIRHPMRRDGTTWKEVSWADAMAEISERAVRIQKEHGNDALAFYYGNPTAHKYSSLLLGVLFAERLKTRSRYSSNSVDALPRLVTSRLVYGSQAILPIPDVERSDFLLVLGGNPVVSQGSIMVMPDAARTLGELRARGGRLVVVDPRRTETAAIADQHLFIRPGTDALLLAAMVHVILKERLDDPGKAARFTDGLDRIASLVRPFTPARVAPVTGIDEAAITSLARDFARAKRAACYGRMGTCMQEFGALASWLVDVLNVVTGRLDVEGGVMFPSPAVDLAALAAMLGQTGFFDRWQSRVSGLPEFNGEFPVAAFAEDIETPGAGQIKALVTLAGNPALSLPNGPRLERAFAALDLMVSIDIYLNETTRHAHFLLPPSFGLEDDEYPVLFHATAIRNSAHWSPALLPKPPGTRHDWEILLDLATRIDKRRGGLDGIVGRASHALLSRIGPRGLLRLLLRIGTSGLSLDDLEKKPHGIDLGPLVPRLPKLLPTGRVDLAPARLVADLARLERKLEAASGTTSGELLLIGRRHARSNNSWMHNSLRLVKGKPRCTLLMHPDDAAARALRTGDTVRLASRVGHVDVPLEVTGELMRGVVSLPHGWGHDRDGARLAVAREHAGASVNDVTDEKLVEAVSGASVLNGVPVTVERAP